MANKFDNHMIFRIILIVLAMFVLFALINYYNSKQTASKANTERFYQQQAAAEQPAYQQMMPYAQPSNETPSVQMSNPLLVQQNIQQTDAVKPGEETSNSDYRAVDFTTNKLPSDCFPRDRLSAEDLLPSDAAANSKWAQVNPAGQGDVSNQNFLTAGWNVGINTVSGSLRNANLQLRSEPPNPRGAWPILNSTITSDTLRRPLELGGDL